MSIASIAIGSFALQGAGSLTQASAAEQMGKQQAAIENYNANLMSQQAQDLNAQKNQALGIAEQDTQGEQEKIARGVATEQASFASAGVLANTGTPLTTTLWSESQMKLSALQDQRNNFIQAYNYGIAAQQATSQSQLDAAQGQIYKQAGGLNAAGSLLSGGAQMGNMYVQDYKAGIFKG